MQVAIVGQKWFGAAVFEAVREAGHSVVGVAAPSGRDQLALAAKRNDVPLQIHGARIEADTICRLVMLRSRRIATLLSARVQGQRRSSRLAPSRYCGERRGWAYWAITLHYCHCTEGAMRCGGLFVCVSVAVASRVAVGCPQPLPRSEALLRRVTGGSIYYLNDGADTGDITAQDWCFIRAGDTPRSLWERELAPIGVRLFVRALGELESGNGRCVAQDVALATFEPSFRCGYLGGGRES